MKLQALFVHVNNSLPNQIQYPFWTQIFHNPLFPSLVTCDGYSNISTHTTSENTYINNVFQTSSVRFRSLDESWIKHTPSQTQIHTVDMNILSQHLLCFLSALSSAGRFWTAISVQFCHPSLRAGHILLKEGSSTPNLLFLSVWLTSTNWFLPI